MSNGDTSDEIIGTIEILKRYPVKSMMGEDLEAGYAAYTGLAGDRVFAFVNPEKAAAGNNFPWHSAREQHDLLLYRPSFRSPPPLDLQYPDAATFAIDVRTPDGRTFDLQDPTFLKELQERAGRPFTLRFSEKGMHDARPISIFGLQTLAALGEETGRTLEPERFRANMYVRWRDDTPFFEDGLVGRRFRIGDKTEIMIQKKDPRCIIITLDPATGTPHPEVLRNVARKHQGCAGVYAVVVKEGVVKRGDAIVAV